MATMRSGRSSPFCLRPTFRSWVTRRAAESARSPTTRRTPYVLPIALAAGCLLAGDPGLPVQIALIWGAHIGIDRFLGYGLKYTAAFKDTHLGRV
jgi:hypothetical protein